jgi:hypothetical protein
MTRSEHEMIVGQNFDDTLITVECTCGWEALHPFVDAEQAADAFDNHCDVVFMEATGG